MENKNLFWYHEEFERDVETKVQHEDEIDFVPSKEKAIVVKGCFSLDHVAAARIVEGGNIEIYLSLAHDQLIPDPSKPKYKNINGQKQLIGFDQKVYNMPMGVTLTVAEDKERFLKLTGGDNV
ncbi:MAG: hypothetical protein RLZZ196_2587 [Bacteroidota bacterium]|jgi:hypothetical protein